MTEKSVFKYLSQYAEPESSNLQVPGNLIFSHCLVIPAFAESADFVERILENWPREKKLLVILILNRPTYCSAVDRKATDLCIERSQALLNEVLLDDGHISWRKSETRQPTFLLIDRCSDLPIPDQQGVGLARKIGCDIALRLHAMGKLLNNWVHTTDADAHLPLDYFSTKFTQGSAKIYPHNYIEASDDLKLATEIYEARNLAYQNGLANAGSAYSFNPTASLMALHLPSYAQVRGFPKKAAGEDFYILNKLQKIHGVQSLDSSPILLECRTSSRVPFGTGPAVAKLLESKQPEAEKIFYHPKCFEIFRIGLTGIRSIDPNLWQEYADIPTEFRNAIKSLTTDSVIQHLTKQYQNDKRQKNLGTKKNYLYHLDLWFDAFRTLKTIHFLRDNYFSSIGYQEWKQLQTD